MKTFAVHFFVVWALIAGPKLVASTITLSDLPAGDTDTISIVLDPLDGAVHGLAGASVGWGFTVNWTSTDSDWLSFTSSSLGSVEQNETNAALLANYDDFIGAQGRPLDFSLSPGSWTEAFDGVSQGVGLYEMTSDPTIAVPGAEDTGEITFNFQVYNGDPLIDGIQIGDSSYAYYGSSTAFSVTVDALPPPGYQGSAAPEPASWLLFGSAILTLLYYLTNRHFTPSQAEQNNR